MGFDIAVGHGSRNRELVAPSCEEVGGGLKPDQVGRTRGLHCGIGPVCPTGTEIDDRFGAGCEHGANRFGGNQGLEPDLVQQVGFDDLSLTKGCLHFQQRFVGEYRGALGQPPDGAGETPVGKRAQEFFREPAQLAQVVEVIWRKLQLYKARDGLLDAGGNQKVPRCWEVPHVQAEHRRFGHLRALVRLQHAQLIQVGEQCRGLFGGGHLSSAPAARIAATALAPSPGTRSTGRMASATTRVSKPKPRASRTVA